MKLFLSSSLLFIVIAFISLPEASCDSEATIEEKKKEVSSNTGDDAAARLSGPHVRSVPQEWLTGRTTVAEAEAAHLHDGKPFGHQNQIWEDLKARMTKGDELWNFNSPLKRWQMLAGREGIALVRDGEIVYVIITAMN